MDDQAPIPSRSVPVYRVAVPSLAGISLGLALPAVLKIAPPAWNLRPWGYALLALSPLLVLAGVWQVPSDQTGWRRARPRVILSMLVGGASAVTGALVVEVFESIAGL